METLENLIEKLEKSLENLKVDAKKFIEKENKAAGTRVRVESMNMIHSLKEVRKKVSEMKS